MSGLSTPAANHVDALLDEFKRLASRRDVGAGLQRVVGRLPVLLGIERAVVYRYNAVNERLVVTHETSGATPSLLGSMQPLAQLPACMVNALETGLQVAIEDFDRYPITESQRRALRFQTLAQASSCRSSANANRPDCSSSTFIRRPVLGMQTCKRR